MYIFGCARLVTKSWPRNLTWIPVSIQVVVAKSSELVLFFLVSVLPCFDLFASLVDDCLAKKGMGVLLREVWMSPFEPSEDDSLLVKIRLN